MTLYKEVKKQRKKNNSVEERNMVWLFVVKFCSFSLRYLTSVGAEPLLQMNNNNNIRGEALFFL